MHAFIVLIFTEHSVTRAR